MACAKAIFLTVLFVLLCNKPASGARCGEFCAFRTCISDGQGTLSPKGPFLILRDAEVATLPFVCRKVVESPPSQAMDQRVKIVKSKPALVLPVDRIGAPLRKYKPISKYRPRGLKKRFKKNFFQLRELDRFPPVPGEVGLSREETTGNQFGFLNNLCVVVPVTSYDLLNEDGTVDKRVKRSKKGEDCVSYRVITAKILVELTWDSPDDLDITVEEPNGEVISFRNRESSTGGKLIRDQNVEVCTVDPDGREQIRWLDNSSNPDPGEYKVTVRHFKSCGRRTVWSLAVVIDGEVVLFQDGVSKRGKNKKLTENTFTFSG